MQSMSWYNYSKGLLIAGYGLPLQHAGSPDDRQARVGDVGHFEQGRFHPLLNDILREGGRMSQACLSDRPLVHGSGGLHDLQDDATSSDIDEVPRYWDSLLGRFTAGTIMDITRVYD